ncbi:MAG: hypothetical protein JWN59_1764 [Sphingomonas bacterium]|jgi:DNA-binding transcriptional regulator YdaS (Cro superfamily)|nr:hypothetical protein [Sphingomonas bacterium]MDB5683563.1 hypothetical protein [Sphingomonas bacterium]
MPDVPPVTPFEALKAAVVRSGSQSAFARLCGVSQTAVWKWLQSGKRLPAEYVLTTEAETGVSRHLLRPDLYPADPALNPLTKCNEGTVATGAPIVACDRGALSQRRARA